MARFLMLLTPVILAGQLVAEPAAAVATKRSPDHRAWQDRPVRRLVDLDGFQSRETPLTRFGGDATRSSEATGFFRVEEIDGRWWFIDPDGARFLSMGLNTTRPPRWAAGKRALDERFGNARAWAESTERWCRSVGLNTLGCWSDSETFRRLEHPLAYTLQWNFASSFGRRKGRTHQKVGHTGFVGDCLPVLDPEFESFCDRHARALAATRDDPWLLGHFSDNELPLYGGDQLNRFLCLPADDVNRREAERWLAARHGGNMPARPREADRVAFRAHLADRYFSIVGAAIRRYDPNHLILGSRFHGGALRERTVVNACAPHLDVISFNCYGRWTPSRDEMDRWASTGRPFVITEFYAKGMDSGMNNRSGAGWTVKAQADRGAFYQNFTLALLEHPACIGWHWHRYRDNDPGDPRSKRFNEESNKGFVNLDFRPYRPLTRAAAEICTQAYPLADFFSTR